MATKKVVGVRLSAEDYAKLRELARLTGRSVSGTLRVLVRSAYAASVPDIRVKVGTEVTNGDGQS